MKRILCALILALILTGCAKQQEVQIPSTVREEEILAALFDGISAFSTEIVLDCSADELYSAFAALLCRNADLFYIGSKYRYAVYDESTVFYPEYTMIPEEVQDFRSRLKARAAELCDGIEENLSVSDRALLLHDRLLRAVEYDEKHRFPLADALLAGHADCEGYARAYQFLLQTCGIKALFVTGETVDGGHAWVMFCDEEGVWYHADPTWDDGTSFSRAYFMQNDAVMRRTHTVKKDSGLYPACEGEDNRFYRQYGLCAAEASVKTAFDHAAAWETGAAEFCFPDGVALSRLKELDEQVQTEAKRRQLILTERITAKNSMVVSYRFIKE